MLMPNSRIQPHIERLYTAYVEPATWVALGVARRMEGQSASLEGHQAVPPVIGHFAKITEQHWCQSRMWVDFRSRLASNLECRRTSSFCRRNDLAQL